MILLEKLNNHLFSKYPHLPGMDSSVSSKKLLRKPNPVPGERDCKEVMRIGEA